MAAREYEEEQTQRTMLSLNALEPSYPGKKTEEVKSVIQEVSHTVHYLMNDTCMHTCTCISMGHAWVMYVYINGSCSTL